MSNLVRGSKASFNSSPSKKRVEIISRNPFSDKQLPDGRKLYVREHGIPKQTVNPGQTVAFIFEIPYPAAKINGAMIVGSKKHDTANFKVLDNDSGTITGVPNYPLNQFGFNVNMTDDKYYKSYPYDADLVQGLVLCIEYTNNGSLAVGISINLDLHEVKA